MTIVGKPKKLDWQWTRGNHHAHAVTPLGTYRITNIVGTEGWVCTVNLNQLEDTVGNKKMTLDTAKEIAYLDFTNKVQDLMETDE